MPREGPTRTALTSPFAVHRLQFIQEGDPTVGHSAKDDAEAALELVRHKVKQRAAGKA